jgi:hypothetical protein
MRQALDSGDSIRNFRPSVAIVAERELGPDGSTTKLSVVRPIQMNRQAESLTYFGAKFTVRGVAWGLRRWAHQGGGWLPTAGLEKDEFLFLLS